MCNIKPRFIWNTRTGKTQERERRAESARVWSSVRRPVRSESRRTARRWWCRTAASSCPSAGARSNSPTDCAGCRAVVERRRETRRPLCSRRRCPRTRAQTAPQYTHVRPANFRRKGNCCIHHSLFDLCRGNTLEPRIWFWFWIKLGFKLFQLWTKQTIHNYPLLTMIIDTSPRW